MELDEGRVPKPLHLLVPDDDVDWMLQRLTVVWWL